MAIKEGTYQDCQCQTLKKALIFKEKKKLLSQEKTSYEYMSINMNKCGRILNGGDSSNYSWMSAVPTGLSKQRGLEVCAGHPFPYYGKLSSL